MLQRKLCTSETAYLRNYTPMKLRNHETTMLPLYIHVEEGATLGQNGLKMRPFHLFGHPEWSNIHFGKGRFSPIFDPFLVPKRPIIKAFSDFHGPKRITTGSTWAQNTCLSIPSGPGSILVKRVFDPFLTHFWSQNGPFSRHFGIFHGPKRVTTGSKRAKKLV